MDLAPTLPIQAPLHWSWHAGKDPAPIPPPQAPHSSHLLGQQQVRPCYCLAGVAKSVVDTIDESVHTQHCCMRSFSADLPAVVLWLDSNYHQYSQPDDVECCLQVP